MTIESLDFTQIRMDGGTQSRADIDEATVREYQEAMAAGAEFPPPIVFHDGSTYWLADGFHRVFAWRRVSLAGRVQCDIRQGTQRDAVLYSVGANTRHGLRRNPADKRRAVLRLLHDPEWGQWSSRAIADKCGVSHTFVDDLRKKAADGNGATGNVASSERVYERAGKRQTMETGNIGGNGREPIYAPISRLESIVRAWLPFRTGGTDRATWLRVLAGLRAGRGDDWHTALLPYVVTRAPQFRADDLAQACRNLYQQIGGEMVAEAVPAVSPQRAELPPLPTAPAAIEVPAATYAALAATYSADRMAYVKKGGLPKIRGCVMVHGRLFVCVGKVTLADGREWADCAEMAEGVVELPRREHSHQGEIVEYRGATYTLIGDKYRFVAAAEAAAAEVAATPPTTVPATTPSYGGIGAFWGDQIPADQVGSALQWLLGEVEWLATNVEDWWVRVPLTSAGVAVQRALEKWNANNSVVEVVQE